MGRTGRGSCVVAPFLPLAACAVIMLCLADCGEREDRGPAAASGAAQAGEGRGLAMDHITGQPSSSHLYSPPGANLDNPESRETVARTPEFSPVIFAVCAAVATSGLWCAKCLGRERAGPGKER